MKNFASVLLGCTVLAGCAMQPKAIAPSLAPVVAPEAHAHPSMWPAAHSPAAITDAATEAAITKVMARMTLAQKVGQVIQGDTSSVTPADLAAYPLGSILAGGNSGPYGDERANGAMWKKQVDAYRTASMSAGAGIPILFGVDAVHGHSNLPSATIFPHNVGLGAAHDVDLIHRIGEATAVEIAATGIEWTFAPTLAAPQDVRWGRSYEGYSSDPALIAQYSKAMVEGLQGKLVSGKAVPSNRVAATAKHFLADGGTTNGKDQGDAQISEAELVALHAQGYPPAIDAGALTVMASFSSWNGVKNHGNSTLLTDVLKGRMGFEGLVVGDWNGHGQVAGCTVTDCPASLNAGLDLYMASDSWKGLFDSLLAQAKDGRVSMARLDDAVRRVLRVKYKLGLMGREQVVRGDVAQVGAPDHLALAREAVAKSLVLLKNDGGVLPLKPGARVLITGPGADSMAMQAGGWTVTWQGTDTTAADYPNGQTIGRALVAEIERAGGTAILDPLGKTGAKADVAIVVYGENPYAEFQGDIPDLAFRPLAGESAMLDDLRAKGMKTVSLFLSGRPLFVGPQMNASDAFVAAWLPGTQGAGVADVLVAGRDGRTARDFTGTLSFAWPRDARSPMTQPLFGLGYGLSYARPGSVGMVNDDPGIEIASSRSDEKYVVNGKAVSPWRLGLDSAITERAVDMGAQENARQFVWGDKARMAIDGPAVNLSRQLDQSFVLRLDMRLDARATGPVLLSVGGGTLDLTSMLAALPKGQETTQRIPLSCFVAAGGNVMQLGTPFALQAPKGFGFTLKNVGIEATGPSYPCPPKAGA